MQAIDDVEGLGAVVAYTHDLQLPSGERAGNFYFEMNNALRDRTPSGREGMMRTWGVAVHYTLRALARLPNIERVCYRGFAHTDAAGKEELLRRYKNGRPIQWGAFTSTTTDLQAARSFARSAATGVVFRIRVLTGKDIRPLSFFATEGEVLLGPAHKFVVTSDTGGHADEAGFVTVDLQQVEGEWFRS